MAKSEAERLRASRAAGRDAYRRELEEKRAKRMAGTIKVTAFNPRLFADQLRLQSWASIHTVLYATAITAAFVYLGYLFGAAGWGSLAALLMMGTLYGYLLRVWNLDLRELARPTMAVGIFLTYFVTWMAASFLAANPPIFDNAPPEIQCCAVLEFNNTSKEWQQRTGRLEWHPESTQWLYNLSEARPSEVSLNGSNGSALLRYGVYDSGGLAAVTLQVFGEDNSFWPPIHPERLAAPVFEYQFTNLTAGGSYRVDITGVDQRGQAANAGFQFKVRA